MHEIDQDLFEMKEDRSEIAIAINNIEKWQEIIDIMAGIIGIPTGLVMRLNDAEIEVLVSSQTESNPYHPGYKEKVRGSGLYCQTVIKSRDKLLVPNALSENRLSYFTI